MLGGGQEVCPYLRAGMQRRLAEHAQARAGLRPHQGFRVSQGCHQVIQGLRVPENAKFAHCPAAAASTLMAGQGPHDAGQQLPVRGYCPFRAMTKALHHFVAVAERCPLEQRGNRPHEAPLANRIGGREQELCPVPRGVLEPAGSSLSASGSGCRVSMRAISSSSDSGPITSR
jgi:hypothetical protein